MTNKYATKECLECHEIKPYREMRLDGVKRGFPPDTCKECRSKHPGEQWCNKHKKFEPESMFQKIPKRLSGFQDRCKIATAEDKGLDMYKFGPRECVACHEVLDSSNFRSRGRMGGLREVCKNCENGQPGKRKCADCGEWKSLDLYTRREEGRFRLRCRPCQAASAHGITVPEVLDRQGSESPECAACGSEDDLHVDHDHSHCPGTHGCRECVRGYLCHRCNIAEGHLLTLDQARGLVAYMERNGIGA